VGRCRRDASPRIGDGPRARSIGDECPQRRGVIAAIVAIRTRIDIDRDSRRFFMTKALKRSRSWRRDRRRPRVASNNRYFKM